MILHNKELNIAILHFYKVSYENSFSQERF